MFHGLWCEHSWRLSIWAWPTLFPLHAGIVAGFYQGIALGFCGLLCWAALRWHCGMAACVSGIMHIKVSWQFS